MTAIEAPRPVTPALPYDLALPWRRLIAFVLDLLFASILWAIPIGIGIGIFFFVHGPVHSKPPSTQEQQQKTINDMPIGLVVVIPMFFVYDYPATALGGGWGKRLLGLHVVRKVDGASPGWSAGYVRAILHTLLVSIYFVGIFAVVGMFRGKYRQAWWDSGAGTVVIKK